MLPGCRYLQGTVVSALQTLSHLILTKTSLFRDEKTAQRAIHLQVEKLRLEPTLGLFTTSLIGISQKGLGLLKVTHFDPACPERATVRFLDATSLLKRTLLAPELRLRDTC